VAMAANIYLYFHFFHRGRGAGTKNA